MASISSDIQVLQANIDAKADSVHTHAAADVVSGTVATARLGGGVADATTFLRGDQTWIAPPGSGGGDAITINGSALVDADFDNATPAAPGGSVNVIWQKDGGSPANVSAHIQKSSIIISGQVVIDFTPGKEQANLVVADTAITSGSIIMCSMPYTPAGGRDLDELEMDQFEVKAGNILAGVSFEIFAHCLSGYGHGVYLVNYSYAT